MYAAQSNPEYAAKQAGVCIAPERTPELPGAMQRIAQSTEALMNVIDRLDNRLTGVVARPGMPQPENKTQIKGAMNTGMGAELDNFNDKLMQGYARIDGLLERLEF